MLHFDRRPQTLLIDKHGAQTRKVRPNRRLEAFCRHWDIRAKAWRTVSRPHKLLAASPVSWRAWVSTRGGQRSDVQSPTIWSPGRNF